MSHLCCLGARLGAGQLTGHNSSGVTEDPNPTQTHTRPTFTAATTAGTMRRISSPQAAKKSSATR